MDPQTISPPLPLEVVYWASSSENTTQKVKFCDVHPEFPWIVSAEKNTINVWDFIRKDCLLEKTLQEILESVEKTKFLQRHQPQQSRGQLSFTEKRTFQSTSQLSVSFIQGVKNGSGTTDAQLPPTLKSVGDIKRVVFADRTTMQWNCGGITIPSTLDTFHSSNRLMIICDGALIFYDFLTGASHAITPADLNRVPISSAEFVYTDLCAIGGADGSIRIWDCLHWKLVKTLITNTRGEISTIRNLLPRCRSCVPNSVGNDSGLREGRIRMLSITSDGSGLLWDSLVMGNIIQINEPTGHLLSQGSFAQHLDDASDTLITVSSDRTIRMWDLTSVKKSESNTGNKVRPGRRASLTGLSSSSAGSEHGRIPCVGKIKSGTVLSPALSKYTHITHLDHPRYPFGTFIVTSKTNSIGFVQIQEATGEEQSEKSSVRSSSDTSLRLVSLHEITLSQIMAAYAASFAAHSASDNTQDSEIFTSKWLSSRDPTTKVYTTQSHPMYSDHIVVTTSVGIIVLNLKSPISAEGGLSAFHPSWKNFGILFTSDKKLQLSRLLIQGSSEFDENSPRPPSTRRASMASKSRQHSRVNSARLLSTTSPPPDEKDPFNPTGLIQLEVFEELNVSAEGVGGNVQMAATTTTQTQTFQKQVLSTKPNNLILACVTSRPIFRASPSGKYCAIHWPESLYYVVLEMNPEIMLNVARGGNKTKEIDHGQCVSLGWITIPVTGEDSISQKDILIIISPSKRLDATKKKKPQYSLFKKKDNTPEGCLPAMLLLKSFSDDGRATETVVSGGPDGVDELFGGSSLICINSVSKMNDSGASDEKKKKAISQIELEAMQAQQAEEKAATGPSKADEIPVHISFKSQFYALRVGTKSRHSSASTMDESTSVSSIGESDFTLTPLGPVMDRVSAIAWDKFRLAKDKDSMIIQYLAVLIDTRVNILKLTSTDNLISLTTIRSIEVSSSSRLIPTSLLWRDGFLFISTYQEILAVFPRPSTTLEATGAGAGGGAAAGTADDSNSTVVDMASLCSLAIPTQSVLTTSGQYRPYGWLEIGNIIDGWMLLLSRECILTPIPLAASPLISLLLQFSKMLHNEADIESIKTTAQYIQLFPNCMREHLMGLFSSWVTNESVLDEIKTQCPAMPLLTECDLLISQRADDQRVAELTHRINSNNNYERRELFGKTISSSASSSCEASQTHGLNTLIQLANQSKLSTPEEHIFNSSFPFNADYSSFRDNLQLFYGDA